MQYLTMPFTRCMMLCGYKNKRYRSHWGYDHFGVDISTRQGGASDDHRILASGTGVVLAAGKDPELGYGLAIIYPDAYNHHTGEVYSVTARYMHMKSLAVKIGDAVKPGTVLGEEGKEGTTDYHLHLEFDTDITAAYATWTPQVKDRDYGFWVKGVDSTVNPSYLLHVGAGQSLAEPTYNPAWLNPEDFEIPATGSTPDVSALQKQINELMAELAQVKAEKTDILNRLRAIVENYKN